MLVTTDTKFDEQILADKARKLIHHQEELKRLKYQKKELESSKPITTKDQLSYEESIELGRQLNKFQNKIQGIENQIQKVLRQISALEHQAQKLIPVRGINIKVSLREEEAPTSYQIRQEGSDKEPNIHVQKL